MAEQYAVSNGSVALVAATAKTLVELTTIATMDAAWIGFDISFDASGTGTNVKVEIVSYAASGTGTAYTPTRLGGNQGRASLSTAEINSTVEPTTPTVLLTWYVPLNSGFSYVWPLGRELQMSVSKVYGIRVTAPSIVNAACNLYFEE
jgi:hypothetical protein